MAVRRRTLLLVERHRIVAQVDRLDAQILALGEAVERPAGRFLTESSLTDGAEDHLDERSRLHFQITLTP